MPKASDLQWCRNLFASLNDGGLWAVPRSGLVFRKERQALVLQETIPGICSVSDSEADYVCIRDHFADAGIRVTKESSHA